MQKNRPLSLLSFNGAHRCRIHGAILYNNKYYDPEFGLSVANDVKEENSNNNAAVDEEPSEDKIGHL